MPGSLALPFDINLACGHANNFLVQNVPQTLVDKLIVKVAATILEETVGYDIYKTFGDLFLPGGKAGQYGTAMSILRLFTMTSF